MLRKRVMLTRPAYAGTPVLRKRNVIENVDVALSPKKTPIGGEKNPLSLRGDSPPCFSVDLKDEAALRERAPVREAANVPSLLDQVATLSKAEQQELLDTLALRNQVSAKAADNRDLDMWSAAIGLALQETIGDGEGGSYGHMLLKAVLGSTACWRPIETFMRTSKLAELKVVERQGVYMMLAKLLVDHADYVAKRSGAPLSAKLVGQCTRSISGVFDSAFPGYLAAGLAPMVARQMRR